MTVPILPVSDSPSTGQVIVCTATTAPAPANADGVAIEAGGLGIGTYMADRYYSGGLIGSAGTGPITVAAGDNAPEALYSHYRFGDVQYVVPSLTPGCSYQVRLHFIETYWTTAGSRVFDVSLNGSAVLSGFDVIAAAGGPNISVYRDFTATASASGTITLTFSTVKDNAMISGIDISLLR
jgi:hypothetical protein